MSKRPSTEIDTKAEMPPPLYHANTSTFEEMLAMLVGKDGSNLPVIKDEVAVDTTRKVALGPRKYSKVKKQTNGTSYSVMAACMLLVRKRGLRIKKLPTAVSYLRSLCKTPGVLTDSNWIKCFNSLSVILDALIASDNSLSNTITSIRKEFRQQQALNPGAWTILMPFYRAGSSSSANEHAKVAASQAGLVFRVSAERAVARASAGRALVDKKQSTKVCVDSKIFTQFVNVCLVADDLPHLVLLVGLATGSRMVEILKVSDYSTIEGDAINIKVTGVAKMVGGQDKVFTKPTILMPPATVCRVVAKIRASALDRMNKGKSATATSMGEFSNEDINQILVEPINRVTNGYPFLGEKSPTSHDMRKIHAFVSHILHPVVGETFPGHIQRTLGHASAEMTLSYNNYYLTDEKHLLDSFKAIYDAMKVAAAN